MSPTERPFAIASWGDDPHGGLILVAFTDVVPTGPPVAPALVKIRDFLRDHWNIALPELRPPFGDLEVG